MWVLNFFKGIILWFIAIAFLLIATKSGMEGFATPHWWWETGAVYLLWGFLNYLIFFGIIEYIIPIFLKKSEYKKMIVYTILLIFVIGLIKYFFVSLKRFDYVLVSYFKNGDEKTPVYFTFLQYLQKACTTGILVALLAYGWGLTVNWFKEIKLRKELETKQLNAELSFLKMQLNPHFLFNTLNSIYALSLKKSDDAPNAVLKLSEMMRYMLYEVEDKDHRVALNNEIAYLENYIALQKIRFREQIKVEFIISGKTENKKIVPLILIPFVENCFKHGDINDEKNPLQIKLVIENDKLVFDIKNKKSTNNKDNTGGIGMGNVKKRLQLLYPNKHNLLIIETNEMYKSELVLYL